MPYADKSVRLEYHKTKMRNWDKLGLCVRCGAARDEQIKKCRECANISNSEVREIIQGYKAAGKCRCGHEVDTLKKTCSACLQNSKRVIRELKLKVLAGYGNRCACCGITEWEFLSVDHVVERGCEERKRLGSQVRSGSFYRKIIKEGFPEHYQLLCFNCNLAFGFYGYCPHHPEIIRPVFKQRGLPLTPSAETLAA